MNEEELNSKQHVKMKATERARSVSAYVLIFWWVTKVEAVLLIQTSFFLWRSIPMITLLNHMFQVTSYSFNAKFFLAFL